MPVVELYGIGIELLWVQLLVDWGTAAQYAWASCSHSCASVTNECNLVLVENNWEDNGRLGKRCGRKFTAGSVP